MLWPARTGDCPWSSMLPFPLVREPVRGVLTLPKAKSQLSPGRPKHLKTLTRGQSCVSLRSVVQTLQGKSLTDFTLTQLICWHVSFALFVSLARGAAISAADGYTITGDSFFTPLHPMKQLQLFAGKEDKGWSVHVDRDLPSSAAHSATQHVDEQAPWSTTLMRGSCLFTPNFSADDFYQ